MKTTRRAFNVLRLRLLIALAVWLGLTEAFGQCYFAKKNTARCAPSIQASCTNDPPCYQQFSTPAYGTHCSYEDYGAEPCCGNVNCTNTTVAVTINYRTGTCYQAGTGPDPSQTEAYCWNDGSWLTKPGGTCEKADPYGACCGIGCEE